MCLDSAGEWLSCQAIIWISVLAGLFRVFANQVTYTVANTQVTLNMPYIFTITFFKFLHVPAATFALLDDVDFTRNEDVGLRCILNTSTSSQLSV